MQINAKIIYKTAEEREMIVQSFFDKDEFSPKNFMRIVNDEEVVIRLVFDQIPPQRIISAIGACEIISMNYNGNQSCDDKIDGLEKVTEDSSDITAEEENNATTDVKAKTVTAEEENNVTTDIKAKTVTVEEAPNDYAKTDAESSKKSRSQKAKKIVKYKRTGRQAPSSKDYIKLSIFNDAAKEATSVDDFVEIVGEKLNLSAKDIDFVQRMTVELLKLKQKAFCLTMRQINIANNKVGHRAIASISSTINERLMYFNVDASLLHFLCTMLKYAKKFAKNIDNDEDAVVNEIEHTETKNAKNSKFFMSEKFTKIFNEIDKSLPREKQVTELFKKMGVKENSSVFITITTLANKAIENETTASVEFLMESSGILPYTDSGIRTRLEVAERIKIICEDFFLPDMSLTDFYEEIRILFT